MNQGTILGNQIGKWIILAVLVAVLAALLTAGVIRSDGHSTTIEYAENGKDRWRPSRPRTRRAPRLSPGQFPRATLTILET